MNLIASMPNISVKVEDAKNSKTEKEMTGQIQPDVISLLDETIHETSKVSNGETFIEEIFSADTISTSERLGEFFTSSLEKYFVKSICWFFRVFEMDEIKIRWSEMPRKCQKCQVDWNHTSLGG